MDDRNDINRALAELQELPTGFISDGMGRLGLHGGWLAGLTPLAFPKSTGCYAGQVLTVQWAPKQGRGGPRLTLYEIIRERREETILLITGGRPDCYLLGENTAMAAKVAGFEAIVVDGCMRDHATLPEVGVGMFTSCVEGGHPDSIEIVAYNLPVMFRGQWIQPGDIVAADTDGAIVFPADRADEVLQHSRIIAELERDQADAIRSESSLEDLFAVLRKKKQPQ